MILKGNIVDIENQRIYKGKVVVENGRIQSITEHGSDSEVYILPGFIDAHIHIESSMLVPSEFARLAVIHGTVATVSDPHEIANVLGKDGVYYMIDNGKKVPFKFNFGAPSCVPATSFESAGAVIDAEGIKELMANDDIKYLAEMMNYPGVLFEDAEVMKKIEWAKHFNKPVDGHAPGLRGKDVKKYIAAGISTDHESFSYDEGLEKLQNGMKILIREGSAAKNFNALIDLVPEHYENMMFCSDDKHPDDLILSHINALVKRGLTHGIDIFKLLKMACINPVNHYNLDVGLLKEGDPADFIVVNNMTDLEVLKTFINGECVAENGQSNILPIPFDCPNNFNTDFKVAADFKIASTSKKINVIEALDGELITNPIIATAKIEAGQIVSDLDNDILKIVVVNRYSNTKPAIAFIKNVGLKEGAIASSVAHDSHNIICVGVNDAMICKAVNAIIKEKGGVCAVSEKDEHVLGLPVAGIMSNNDGITTGGLYQKIDLRAKEMGATLHAPYMTLSFMALLVIPALKLSDFGLFDGSKFEFTPVNIPE
ncbi:MAG: adenine deaminase [Crocinitomix sp.]|nr:adenine deaminase [Crocinitomix sp.]